jgi:small-conductance mechanosensitive channel
MGFAEYALKLKAIPNGGFSLDKLIHQDVTVVGDWTLSVILLALWLVAGFAIVRWFFFWLRHRGFKSPLKIENVLVKALPVPFYFLLVITGFMFSSRFAPFLETDELQIFRILKVLLLLALIYLMDNLVQSFMKFLESRHEDLKNSHVFFSALIHIMVWSLGLLVLLDSLGISITPLLASLGVGSLAVALGFQNTFANLFSGMYLLIDKPVQTGHFVKLTSGESGFVGAIGWRSTQIRTLDNHLVILPNSKLAENLIQNFSLPSPECPLSVEVGVDYASDLEQVERVTLEVAGQIQREVPGASRNYSPSVSFHTFGPSSILFSVGL